MLSSETLVNAYRDIRCLSSEGHSGQTSPYFCLDLDTLLVAELYGALRSSRRIVGT
jgi:hypothetical protein